MYATERGKVFRKKVKCALKKNIIMNKKNEYKCSTDGLNGFGIQVICPAVCGTYAPYNF